MLSIFLFMTKYIKTSVKFDFEVMWRIKLFPFKKSKKEGKDQESIESSTIPDPGYQWESDTVTISHYKQEPRGQPFPSR